MNDDHHMRCNRCFMQLAVRHLSSAQHVLLRKVDSVLLASTTRLSTRMHRCRRSIPSTQPLPLGALNMHALGAAHTAQFGWRALDFGMVGRATSLRIVCRWPRVDSALRCRDMTAQSWANSGHSQCGVRRCGSTSWHSRRPLQHQPSANLICV